MPSTDLVKSLARGLDILSLVAESDHGLRLSEIAAAMDLKPPTAHNLARTLTARGYLQKVGRGPHYALGPAALGLAEGHLRRRMIMLAESKVRELAEAFPTANVVFCEPMGGELTVRIRMSPERPGALQRPLSQTLNPYASASGVVYMAFCTAEERRAMAHRSPFQEYGAPFWRTREAFEAYLKEVREKGYAALKKPKQEVYPVAAPVFGMRYETLATLGASLPWEPDVTTERQRRVIEAVREASGSLSSAENGL